MDKKLNISFEIEDIYNHGDFRLFVKFLLSEDNKYNLFLISNADSSSQIAGIAKNLGLDSGHVVVCNFTDDKLQAIRDNQIDIHFDNLQSFVMLVDETTNAYGILVTSMENKYYAKKDYMVTFDQVLFKIKKENEEKS